MSYHFVLNVFLSYIQNSLPSLSRKIIKVKCYFFIGYGTLSCRLHYYPENTIFADSDIGLKLRFMGQNRARTRQVIDLLLIKRPKNKQKLKLTPK